MRRLADVVSGERPSFPVGDLDLPIAKVTNSKPAV